MKKSLFAAALSGAALVAAATPAHAALAGLGTPGGPFSAVGFAAASLIGGVPVAPPDPNAIIEHAKEQNAQQHQGGH